jgi:menaquinone-specific isochorismate synthase
VTTSATPDGQISPLVARTVALDLDTAASLLDLLPADRPVTWLRRGDGLIGWGVAAEIRTSGVTRFSDAGKWWAETTTHAVVRNDVNEPGSGLVCFGSFAFADEPGDSVLTVPEIVVGRRGDVVWLTTISQGALDMLDRRDDVLVVEPAAAPVGVSFADGSLNGEQWMSVVADAVARINEGELEKVVLARDLVATCAEPVDVRWPLRRLVEDYPMCWTFHVDGLFGATPEMLVRRERGLVTSRVLAGTIRRTGDDDRDLALAATLARSSKDLEEHEYAVRSVADSLDPHCSSMNVPEAPFVLHLPNVMHLATDVAGVVHDAETVSSLQLAEALHPSAAVGGTPTSVAVDLIAEIEQMERGRYAGPVGWMDATGDGEWGIALRSAHLSGNTVRLYAGCGIVADSDPEAELAEAQAKFVPVRDALAGS